MNYTIKKLLFLSSIFITAQNSLTMEIDRQDSTREDERKVLINLLEKSMTYLPQNIFPNISTVTKLKDNKGFIINNPSYAVIFAGYSNLAYRTLKNISGLDNWIESFGCDKKKYFLGFIQSGKSEDLPNKLKSKNIVINLPDLISMTFKIPDNYYKNKKSTRTERLLTENHLIDFQLLMVEPGIPFDCSKININDTVHAYGIYEANNPVIAGIIAFEDDNKNSDEKYACLEIHELGGKIIKPESSKFHLNLLITSVSNICKENGCTKLITVISTAEVKLLQNLFELGFHTNNIKVKRYDYEIKENK